LYTILCEIARKIVHPQEELDKGGNDDMKKQAKAQDSSLLITIWNVALRRDLGK